MRQKMEEYYLGARVLLSETVDGKQVLNGGMVAEVNDKYVIVGLDSESWAELTFEEASQNLKKTPSNHEGVVLSEGQGFARVAGFTYDGGRVGTPVTGMLFGGHGDVTFSGQVSPCVQM